MNNNEELKLCPFCGSKATFSIRRKSGDSDKWSSVVRCKKCHAEVWGDKDKAITKWNKRSNSDIDSYKLMKIEYENTYEKLKEIINALK